MRLNPIHVHHAALFQAPHQGLHHLNKPVSSTQMHPQDALNLAYNDRCDDQ
jgi:hypothetical protein